MLNLTRDEVNNSFAYLCSAKLRKDWLAMYDLLKEIADCKGIALKNCDGEVLPRKYIENKIHALIGGE